MSGLAAFWGPDHGNALGYGVSLGDIVGRDATPLSHARASRHNQTDSSSSRVDGSPVRKTDPVTFPKWKKLQITTAAAFLRTRILSDRQLDGDLSDGEYEPRHSRHQHDCRADERADDLERQGQGAAQDKEKRRERAGGGGTKQNDDHDNESDDASLLETQDKPAGGLLGIQQEGQYLHHGHISRGHSHQYHHHHHHHHHQNKEGQDAATQPTSNTRRVRIPHASRTMHVITKMEDLDMYTKQASFGLCRVCKYWRLRQTKRAINYRQATHHAFANRAPVYPGRAMDRTVYPHVQDDGPLMFAYDTVVSLEVEQLILPSDRPHLRLDVSVDASQNTEDGPANIIKTSKRQSKRLRIFLYQKYATWMDQWMQSHNSDGAADSLHHTENPILMRLDDIPAKCIFPYALDPSNLREQTQLLDYCLCVGGRFKIYRSEASSKVCSIRMESPDAARSTIIHRNVSERKSGDGGLVLRVAKPRSSASLTMDRNGKVLRQDDDTIATCFAQWQSLQPKPTNAICSNRSDDDDDDDIEEDSDHGTPTGTEDIGERNPTQPIPRPQPHGHGHGTLSAKRKANDEVQAMPGAETELAQSNRNRVEDGRPIPGEENPPSSTFRPAAKRNRPNEAKKYARLDDLEETLEQAPTGASPIINAYGVVAGFRLPKQTRTGGWSIAIDLIDESISDNDVDSNSNRGSNSGGNIHAVVDAVNGPQIKKLYTLVIFGKRDAFPSLWYTGDVIRMHRVAVQRFQDAVQLLGTLASSYVVIRKGGDGTIDGWSRKSPSHSYSFTQQDNERSRQLWRWGQEYIANHSTLHPVYKQTLSSTRERPGATGDGDDHDHDGGEHFESFKHVDAVMMVVNKLPNQEIQPSLLPAMGYMRVWDGTGLSQPDPLPVSSQEVTRRLNACEPSVACVERIAEIIQKLNDGTRSSNDSDNGSGDRDDGSGNKTRLQTPKTLCGAVCNAVVLGPSQWDFIQSKVPIGSFIRLRNVACDEPQGQVGRCLIITESSWISLLPDTALEVRAMLEAHNQRIISNDQYNPQSAFLPVRDDDDLRDATTRKPSEQQQENVAQGESVEAPPAAAVAASTDPRPTIPAGGNAGATVTATTTPPTESSTATTLAELKTLPLPANFVGEVGIVNTFPPIDDGAEHLCRRSGDDFEYSFGVWLADATAVLNVLVVGSRGESLFGMSASDVMKNPRSAGRNIVGDSSMWRASIQAVKSKGKEFFVLRSISRRTEDV